MYGRGFGIKSKWDDTDKIRNLFDNSLMLFGTRWEAEQFIADNFPGGKYESFPVPVLAGVA